MRSVLAASLLLLPLGLQPAFAASETFKARLLTSTEVPPKTGNGNGEATVTLDPATREITYDVSFRDLSGPATTAHIHGPAPAGKNAGVLVPLGHDPSSPIHGTATLTADQVTALENGQTYVNVHTKANPGGEIRGQLMK